MIFDPLRQLVKRAGLLIRVSFLDGFRQAGHLVPSGQVLVRVPVRGRVAVLPHQPLLAGDVNGRVLRQPPDAVSHLVRRRVVRDGLPHFFQFPEQFTMVRVKLS